MRNITISRFVVLLDVLDNRRGACHLGGSNLLLRRFACDKIKTLLLHVKLTTKIKSKICGFFVGNRRQSSNIFGNLRQFSGILGSLRESSEIFGNRRRMAKISLVY